MNNFFRVVKMEINKECDNHKNLVLPVILILTAAFLATSLSIGGRDAITGAVTGITGQQVSIAAGDTNRCKWFSNLTWPATQTQYNCPADFPKISAGGCSTDGHLRSSVPLFGNNQGWFCAGGSNNSAPPTVFSKIIQIDAYCCKYNS